MKTIGFISTALTGLAVLLAGCASTSSGRIESPTSAATVPHEQGGMMADVCPMKVPGTTVTSADVEGGSALAFATSTGNIAELRQRVRHMAEMHNRHYAAGGVTMGDGGTASVQHEREAGAVPVHDAGDREGMILSGGMMMTVATASVEDIESGARLILRPKNPAQIHALREHARIRARRMAGGECPMMLPSPEGAPPPGN